MGVLDRYRERRGTESALRADVARLSNNVRIAEANEALATEDGYGYSGPDALDYQLRQDEAGWMRLGNESADFTHDERRRVIQRARVMAIRNPLVRRRVRVLTSYVFGQGVEIGAKDEALNEVIQEFMTDYRNEAVLTSPLSMGERERDLQTDGNLFFALFTNQGTGDVIVRVLPAPEIEDIRTSPDDAAEPRYYLRTFTLHTDMGPEQRRFAYIDHQYLRTLEADGTAPDEVITANGSEYELATDEAGSPVRVIHIRVGGIGGMKFGHPEVYSMLDWATAYKSYLEDSASTHRSLSRFAWQATTSGKVSKATQKLNSKLSTDSFETNPPPLAGSVFVGGPNEKLAPISTSGAAPDMSDGLQLRKMAAAGADLPDTILSADPDMGNLATAKTLDRPTELTMMMRQSLWSHFFRTLLHHVLVSAVEAGELAGTITNEEGNITVALEGGADDTIDVVWPPVLQPDIGGQVSAVVDALTLAGHPVLDILPPRTGTELMLAALTVDDTDEILDALYPNADDPFGLTALADKTAADNAAKAALPAFGQPNPQALPPKQQPALPPSESAMIEAVRGLAAAIEALKA